MDKKGILHKMEVKEMTEYIKNSLAQKNISYKFDDSTRIFKINFDNAELHVDARFSNKESTITVTNKRKVYLWHYLENYGSQEPSKEFIEELLQIIISLKNGRYLFNKKHLIINLDDGSQIITKRNFLGIISEKNIKPKR